MGSLAPAALAQRPPAPPPPPSTPPSGRPTNSTTPGTIQPNQSTQDLVMFLLGRVATSDGTRLPNDALVERVCTGGVRQQVHASSNGEFSMQLGSRNDSFLDATGDQPSQNTVNSKTSEMGIPRRSLANCELRASVSGF